MPKRDDKEREAGRVCRECIMQLARDSGGRLMVRIPPSAGPANISYVTGTAPDGSIVHDFVVVEPRKR